jgi:hypothetical protein
VIASAAAATLVRRRNVRRSRSSCMGVEMGG